MRTRAITFIIIVALVFIGAFYAGRWSVAPVIAEDDPRWKCLSMCNRVCESSMTETQPDLSW